MPTFVVHIYSKVWLQLTTLDYLYFDISCAQTIDFFRKKVDYDLGELY